MLSARLRNCWLGNITTKSRRRDRLRARGHQAAMSNDVSGIARVLLFMPGHIDDSPITVGPALSALAHTLDELSGKIDAALEEIAAGGPAA
jgi:hypothetical protein